MNAKKEYKKCKYDKNGNYYFIDQFGLDIYESDNLNLINTINLEGLTDICVSDRSNCVFLSHRERGILFFEIPEDLKSCNILDIIKEYKSFGPTLPKNIFCFDILNDRFFLIGGATYMEFRDELYQVSTRSKIKSSPFKCSLVQGKGIYYCSDKWLAFREFPILKNWIPDFIINRKDYPQLDGEIKDFDIVTEEKGSVIIAIQTTNGLQLIDEKIFSNRWIDE